MLGLHLKTRHFERNIHTLYSLLHGLRAIKHFLVSIYSEENGHLVLDTQHNFLFDLTSILDYHKVC